MAELLGSIVNFQKYSLSDGSGIRTVVFFKGCPMRCKWCHNPETWRIKPELLVNIDKCIGCGRCLPVCKQEAITAKNPINREICIGCGRCADVCPSGARELAGKQYTVDEVISKISSDDMFYSLSGGGITLSGGEPLMQHEFAFALAKRLKEELYDLAIETSGYGSWQNLWAIAEMADEVFYDIKLVDDAKHRQFTGVSNDLILQNVRQLVMTGKNVVFRTPVIGNVNANTEEISHIGEFLHEIGAKKACLLQYHNYAKTKYSKLNEVFHDEFFPPSAEELNYYAELMQKNYGIDVYVETH